MDTLTAFIANAKVDTLIAGVALAVSLCSLLISAFSLVISRRSLRPIITVAVKTHPGEPDETTTIAYDLVVLNSGTIPAKDIQITVDEISLNRAFGQAGTKEREQDLWLSGFGKTIPILQNGDRISGSFGYTSLENAGFWKADAPLQIVVRYKGWFGQSYKEEQTIFITDSESFTGHWWGRK
jgi:hypothetical protein